MPIKLKFLGGTGTVTGSSHLITAGKTEILLDAGLFQGHRDEFYKVNTTFDYNPRLINALILSHAHIDHCGNIPNLIKGGLRCKIYTTSATKDLAGLMLEDSGKIQEEDIKYLNKINRRIGLAAREPLYTKKEASRAIKAFRPISYNQKFCVAKNAYVTLVDAGHILGSAIVILDVKDEGQDIRLGYAVDLGRRSLPLLNDPVIPKGLDYLIIESTYGGRLHAPIGETQSKLREVISRTLRRGGKVLIPSFTLERAQEVVYFLNKLLKDKLIPSVPIYVDSPLATDITGVFEHHLECLDEQTRSDIARGNNPFELLNLRFIRGQNESKALNADKRPMIIIAGSGMCESGRILHHLQNNIEDSRNTIIVVGYMAKDTLGRRIVDREKFVRIFGVEYELNAEVAIINAMSGHADQKELSEFVAGCLPLKRVFLVHGEEEQTKALFDLLIQQGLNAYIPSKGEEVLLD
ncbi:MAG: MBL fold metallo-hydrolase [Candidatus Omnitrophica bacterium CG08_land_8_20_14_0_20_41_16]|uniref:MBL fold metallo-hydrolase n=1 Tax=Candidatus Sherwoodlollariibacterium unditelluris TaxID=1974757 RepID=A0A2G9YK40_9BACT|nr:MAG: MBL fold metallo-hydrolase [Candidatus Omnitrophica bacterium CG23_combo_of_CG06-09_8_20_14_all_41_10]PIS34283.1 MAG: MBL fold metallo-hydrolase [Candidatus Omnitrophica bacterium CG08_land_8_20_14_0_20_41_16]